MEQIEVLRAKVLSETVIEHVNRYNAGRLIGLVQESAADEENSPLLSYSCLCKLANSKTNEAFGFHCEHISKDLENIQLLANRIGVPNLAVMVINDKKKAPGDKYLVPFKRLHPGYEKWGLSDDELIACEQSNVIECNDWARFLKDVDSILGSAQEQGLSS